MEARQADRDAPAVCRVRLAGPNALRDSRELQVLLPPLHGGLSVPFAHFYCGEGFWWSRAPARALARVHPELQPEMKSPRAIPALTFEPQACVIQSAFVERPTSWAQPLDIAAEAGAWDVAKLFHVIGLDHSR